MGTISMRRRSRQEALRKVASGSEALYGGRGVSKDIGGLGIAWSSAGYHGTCGVYGAVPDRAAAVKLLANLQQSLTNFQILMIGESLVQITCSNISARAILAT